MLHAALDAGINFIDTAPVYGEAGFGETLLADVLKAQRDEIVLTTKCGYDIDARAQVPRASRNARTTGSRRRSARSSRRRCAGSAPTTSTSTSCTTPRIEPIRDDALWEELEKFRTEGKVRELGVALGPAIGWVEEGLEAIRDRDIVSLQTVFNVLEQEPGLTFAADPAVADGRVGLISRVPHASDTLSGKITRDTEFPPGDHRAHRNRDNMLDNFDKAETLDVPLGGHRPHRRPGRDRRHPRQPGVRHRAPHVRDRRRRQRVRGGVRPAAHRRREARGSTRCGPTTSGSPTATRCR